MLKLLSYLIRQRVATAKELLPPLDEACIGMPKLTEAPCLGGSCNVCAEVCPTDCITITGEADQAELTLDRGACIACGLCIESCPTGTIARDLSTAVARRRREDLVLSTQPAAQPASPLAKRAMPEIFKKSLAVRVVSTGCSACDLEIGAAGNPIFDMERFGVSIVASPRAADALVVTGPVGKGMQSALLSCYEAMAEPRLVVAAGTCSISGGVHKGGYTEANGVDSVLPVDVYIPGCPPHPWSIIHGLMLAMDPGSKPRDVPSPEGE